MSACVKAAAAGIWAIPHPPPAVITVSEASRDTFSDFKHPRVADYIRQYKVIFQSMFLELTFNFPPGETSFQP